MSRRALTAFTALLCTALLTTAAPTAGALPQDVERVAIIGDSITTGYGVGPGQGYADLLETDQPGDNVLPIAHDGWTARRWLTASLPELRQQLDQWQPATVLVAVGGNDWYIGRKTGDYQTDLTYLTWHIRDQVPGARVIYWHYYGFGVPQDQAVCDVWPCTPTASTWAAYGAAMRDTAVRNAAGYIDDSARAPSGQPWSAYYSADRVHLTPDGHRQLHTSIRARLLACC